jgi:RND family efflux transporter MFP subunit
MIFRARAKSFVLLFALWVGAVDAQVSIEVQPLEAVLVERLQRAPAEVLPLNNSVLAAEVNAVVAAVHADVGADVDAGALLLELDDTDFLLQREAADASLAAARSRLAEAEAKLERAQRLGEAQYVSADELLARETAVAVSRSDIRSAEVRLAIAQRDLDKCRIVAPFAGTVQDRAAQVGAYVRVGSPLLQLVQTDRIELAADIPVAASVGLEGAGEYWFESGGDRWMVQLARISSVVDADRRARRARFLFEGVAPNAGRSGEVVWRLESGQLPAGMLTRRDGALGVFLYRDGVAEFVPLPGAEEGRPAAVDLPHDSLVIVQGRQRLQDGDRVTLR